MVAISSAFWCWHTWFWLRIARLIGNIMFKCRLWAGLFFSIGQMFYRNVRSPVFFDNFGHFNFKSWIAAINRVTPLTNGRKKINLVDVYNNRWHHSLILLQVVINHRTKWGTDIVLVLTRAVQLSTDTHTVDWWYSSVRPVRGPVARKFTGST